MFMARSTGSGETFIRMDRLPQKVRMTKAKRMVFGASGTNLGSKKEQRPMNKGKSVFNWSAPTDSQQQEAAARHVLCSGGLQR